MSRLETSRLRSVATRRSRRGGSCGSPRPAAVLGQEQGKADVSQGRPTVGWVTERFRVELEADQFDELCRPSQPLAGVLELIWNGLDAEADQVTVAVSRTDLDGVDSIKVIDNGHGMTHDDAVRDFRKLGGSWKKGRSLSLNQKRSLHGKKGQGRFRAFALGGSATWESVAEGMSGLERTTIAATLANSEFVVEGPEELATGSLGTMVTIDNPREGAGALLGDRAPDHLLIRLAAYLSKYPHVRVVVDGAALDPSTVLENEVRVELDPGLGGAHGAPVIRIVEWRPSIVGFKSALLLCDQNGVVVHEIGEDMPSTPRKVTGYVEWAGFPEHADLLPLAEMGDSVVDPIVTAARTALAEYLEERDAAERLSILDGWKADRVYPYVAAASNPLEQTERAIFDAVAVTAAPAVSKEPKAAKLSLRLIREALEQSPGALHRVLTEVLDLTPQQLADFDQILRTASLPSIIEATRTVTDRLTFVEDLRLLLFDPEGKKHVLERDHLHKILEAGRTWVFGEEYSLVASERSLTNVLRAHLNLLGKEPPHLDVVKDAEGNSRRRVDLMLSKTAQGPSGQRHLVVELKRPSLVLKEAELTQITKYAIAVTKDPAYQASQRDVGLLVGRRRLRLLCGGHDPQRWHACRRRCHEAPLHREGPSLERNPRRESPASALLPRPSRVHARRRIFHLRNPWAAPGAGRPIATWMQNE